MSKRRCSVSSCLHINRKNDTEKRSMFQCPKDEQKARKWAILIPGIEALSANQVVCEVHFEPRFIKRYFEKNNPRCRLANEALPTIFAEYTLNYQEISSILSSDFIDYDMSNIYIDIDKNNRSVISNPVSNHNDNHHNINANSHSRPFWNSNLINKNIGKIFPKPAEASLQDIVKDLSASEQLLMNIKKEVLSSPENGVSRIKDEYSEDFSEKVKMEVNTGTRYSAIYEQLQNNFAYFATLLPESWSMSQLPLDNNEVFVFSKECTISDEGLMVMYEKNIVLNSNGEILFSVHGQQLNVDHQNLPSVLKDIQSLLDIILKFNNMIVCQGICTNEFEVDKDNILYKDDLGCCRHINCTLLVEKDQCHYCYEYSQYLLTIMKKNTAVLKNKTVFCCD